MGQYSDIKIDWFGEITTTMGYGLQARRMLRPLIEDGATVKLILDEDYVQPYMKINDPFWNSCIEVSKNLPDNPIRINYCLPNRARPNPSAKNIFYAMWETDRYPNEWARIINNSANYFFAGCDALVDSAKKAGINIPIYSMPAGIDINAWTMNGPSLKLNELAPDTITFLFIGNFIPRKNLEELIQGFCCAFPDQQDVALIIKTWATQNTADHKQHITNALRSMQDKVRGINRPKICVISDIMEEDLIIKLIRGADVYTSVSKGEGFDLPMVQAMALGKLIVTTRFLAHKDYLNDDNSLDVKYSLIPCMDAAAPLYDSYQYWSRPDMGHYIEQLRKAYSLVKTNRQTQLGLAARETIVKKYSTPIHTEYLAKTLREIRDRNEKTSDQKIIIEKLVKEYV